MSKLADYEIEALKGFVDSNFSAFIEYLRDNYDDEAEEIAEEISEHLEQ